MIDSLSYTDKDAFIRVPYLGQPPITIVICYAAFIRSLSRLVFLTKVLPLSVIRARVVGWLRTPATAAPIAKEARAKAKSLFDSSLIRNHLQSPYHFHLEIY